MHAYELQPGLGEGCSKTAKELANEPQRPLLTCRMALGATSLCWQLPPPASTQTSAQSHAIPAPQDPDWCPITAESASQLPSPQATLPAHTHARCSKPTRTCRMAPDAISLSEALGSWPRPLPSSLGRCEGSQKAAASSWIFVVPARWGMRGRSGEGVRAGAWVEGCVGTEMGHREGGGRSG